MCKDFKKFNTIFILFITIAVISEIFLIKQNLLLKSEIQFNRKFEILLSQLQSKQKKLYYENSFEGRDVPFFLKKRLLVERNNVLKGIKSEFLIILIFSLDDCGSCLQTEFSTWNAFAGLCDNKICQVIGVTGSDNLQNIDIKDLLNIRFPVIQIDSLISKLNEYGIKSTPIVILVHNRTAKIIYFYSSDTNDKSREKFVKKIESIFEKHRNKI